MQKVAHNVTCLTCYKYNKKSDMASVFDYVFNLSGNFTQNITGMTDATGRFSGALTGTTEKIQKVVAVLGSFDYFRSIVQNMADGLNQVTAAG